MSKRHPCDNWVPYIMFNNHFDPKEGQTETQDNVTETANEAGAETATAEGNGDETAGE